MSLGAAKAALLGAAGAGGAGVDYSAAIWLDMYNMTISGAGLIATANTGLSVAHAISSIPMSGKIYVEVETQGFGGGESYVGLSPTSATYGSNVPDSNAVHHTIATDDLAMSTYGIAYDADTGDYEIYKNGVLSLSGIVPNAALDMRVWVRGGIYSLISVSTLNPGTSAFIYTPPAGY